MNNRRRFYASGVQDPQYDIDANDAAMSAAADMANAQMTIARARRVLSDTGLKVRADGGPRGKWRPGESLPGAVIQSLEAPTVVFRVSGFSSVAAGVTSPAITFNFQQGGEIVSLGLTTLGDGSAAGLASLGLKVTMGPKLQDLFQNQTTADFVPFATLIGNQQMMPFLVRRYIFVHETWTFQVKNYSTGTAYIPEIVMMFREDPDGLRQLSP